MDATAQEEMFEIFDADFNLLGLERRSVVHRKGYYHRSVNVFVFHKNGTLLMQRRSAAKDICPHLWDLSAAEHVQPQEPYATAAARGLKEELDISVKPTDLVRIRSKHLHRYDDDARDRHDYEFVESYRLDDFSGNVTIDPNEVAEYKYTTLDDLKRMYEQEPESLTPWLRSELAMFSAAGFETIRTTRVPT
eukprot:TRINITY_DN15826_c0_g1_i1.p1 TRINITY_DN15826_c0_g1~~TRINITY_DN15826_c0_g1_i1.p1  ORF type:complete len:218 (-),score=13.94 TRINITY_DN15826_c0_g1_i1:56-631(-)